MNIDKKLIESIQANGKFSEVHQVIGAGVFYCSRNTSSFRVEIVDSGDPADMYRYFVYVFNENGTRNYKARGNGANDILNAIAIVHWDNLELDDNFLAQGES